MASYTVITAVLALLMCIHFICAVLNAAILSQRKIQQPIHP